MMNRRPTKPGQGKTQRLIGRLFDSRGFMALVSLLLAVVCWGMLVAGDTSVTRPKTFTDAPISVTGEATLRSSGYIIMDDLETVLPKAKFTVEVSRANYSRATIASYNPHIDVGQLKAGENTVPVQFTSQAYGKVLTYEPASVTLHVEPYITRRVPVVLVTEGTIREDLYLHTTRTDPTQLYVSGPESVVSEVVRAVVTLDLEKLSPERMSDRTSLPITLEDSDGNPIKSELIEITSQNVRAQTVIVETECYPTKLVPIALGGAYVGTPAEGYEVTGVTCSVEALRVAAKAETLEGIETLTVEQPMDITGASHDVDGAVQLRRPSGAENTLRSEVSLTVHITEQTIEKTFRQVPVEVSGLADDRKASLSRGHMTVQLTGPYHFINDIIRDDLQVYVEVDGLEPGEYVLPVQVRVDNAPAFGCALSASEVTVTIK